MDACTPPPCLLLQTLEKGLLRVQGADHGLGPELAPIRRANACGLATFHDDFGHVGPLQNVAVIPLQSIVGRRRFLLDRGRNPDRVMKGYLSGEDDIRIVEIWSKLRRTGFTEKRGFSIDLIAIYRDLIDVLVRKEMQVFATRLAGKARTPWSVPDAGTGCENG